MFVSRSNRAARSIALAFAAVVGMALSGVLASPAQADIERFWEQGPVQAKKAKRQKASVYRRAGKKYASAKKTRYVKRKKLGGYAAKSEPRQGPRKGVRVASLGDSYYPQGKAQKSLSGGGVQWAASSSCLAGSLKSVVYQVAANFGKVRVNSTCRNHSRNRAVGGARRSKHLSGNAVDFRVFGNVRAVYAFLKRNGSVGGLKHYGGGLFHIDNGARRSW